MQALWLRVLLGDRRVGARLCAAEARLANAHLTRFHALRDELDLVRSAWLLGEDQTQAALATAATVLPRAQGDDIEERARLLCRFAYWRNGALDSLRAMGRLSPRPGGTIGQELAGMMDSILEAAAKIDQLQPSALPMAMAALEAADTMVGSDSLPAALTASLVAQALYDRGRLQDAATLLNDRLGAIRRHGGVDGALRAYPLLARMAGRAGEFGLARLLLQEAQDLGLSQRWPRLVAAALGEHLDLMLAFGDRSAAQVCADQLVRLAQPARRGAEADMPDLQRQADLARAKIRLHQGEAFEAIQILTRLRNAAVVRSAHRSALELQLLLVRALLCDHRRTEARELIREAIEAGAGSEASQLLLDAGPDVVALLKELAGTFPVAETRSLLGAVLHSVLMRPPALPERAPRPRADFRSQAALSRREASVLAQFGHGLSNKRIAQTLCVSPETIKSHAKHIFAKLGVQGRDQAVAKARLLGLI